jgi:hypothetical protein
VVVEGAGESIEIGVFGVFGVLVALGALEALGAFSLAMGKAVAVVVLLF